MIDLPAAALYRRLLPSLLLASVLLLPPPAGAQEYPLHTAALPVLSGPVAPGSNIQMSVDGFEAFGILTVTLESDPVLLGEFDIDANGSVAIDVAIPVDTVPGEHTLKASGPSPEGGILVASTPVVVSAPEGSPPDEGSSLPSIALRGGAGAILGALLLFALYRRLA